MLRNNFWTVIPPDVSITKLDFIIWTIEVFPRAILSSVLSSAKISTRDTKTTCVIDRTPNSFVHLSSYSITRPEARTSLHLTYCADTRWKVVIAIRSPRRNCNLSRLTRIVVIAASFCGLVVIGGGTSWPFATNNPHLASSLRRKFTTYVTIMM